MDSPERILAKVQQLISQNPKYKFEAYSFILAALHDTMQRIKPPRHVSGQEFCEGVRRYAIDQFGPMTQAVLEHWGLKETEDFGHVVFALVGIGLMRKTEEDSLDDFKNIYDFKTAFASKAIFDA